MLVIKANAILTQAKLANLANTLTEQAKNGVVVLPDFCDLLTEEECAQKHRSKFAGEMKPGGCPGTTCFVKGCQNAAADQPHYYIDFDAEHIAFA